MKKNKYNTTQDHSNNNSHSNIHMVVPHTNGSSESFKNICGKIGFQAYFKGGNTIGSPLVVPKDKDKITPKSGVIYR